MPFVYFFQCLSDFKILSMWTMVSFRLFFCILNFVIKKPPVYYLPGYFLYIRCGFLLWAHCSEAHFCLCSSHAAWVTELNSNIPLVPWRQNRPRAMTISRLEVSCSITVCVCIHPTLCNPMDCSSPVSSAHGILQAKVLEWLAISCSRGSSQPRDWTGSPALQEDSLSSEPPRKTHWSPGLPKSIPRFPSASQSCCTLSSGISYSGFQFPLCFWQLECSHSFS